jgi:hypothetical protein
MIYSLIIKIPIKNQVFIYRRNKYFHGTRKGRIKTQIKKNTEMPIGTCSFLISFGRTYTSKNRPL